MSIIIPAYNEENRLPNSLEQVFNFLGEQTYTSEVIVVENGSTDRTFELAQNFAQRHKNLRVIHNEERGKGGAVLRGVREALGKYVFICDADLSMPVAEIGKFLPPTLNDFGIAADDKQIDEHAPRVVQDAHFAVRIEIPVDGDLNDPITMQVGDIKQLDVESPACESL